MRYLLIGCLFMGFLLTSCDDDSPASSSADPDPDPQPQELEEYFRATIQGRLVSFPSVSLLEYPSSVETHSLTGSETSTGRVVSITLNSISPGNYVTDHTAAQAFGATYMDAASSIFESSLPGSSLSLDDDAPAGYVKGSFTLKMSGDLEITDGKFLAKVGN